MLEDYLQEDRQTDLSMAESNSALPLHGRHTNNNLKTLNVHAPQSMAPTDFSVEIVFLLVPPLGQKCSLSHSISKCTGQIVLKLVDHIYCPHMIKPTAFTDLMTPTLAPPLGQNVHFHR